MSSIYVPNQSVPPHTMDPGRRRKPQAWITLDAWQRLLTYVKLCAVEINGFGLVSLLDDNTFLIDEVLITEQTVSAGSADASDGDMHKVMFDMINEGRDFERLRCQWHSHVTGATRYSEIDMATIERYQADWWISLLVNHFGHVSCRLDVFQPVSGIGIYLPLQVLVPGPAPETVEAIAAEMEQKVQVLPQMAWDGKKYSVVLGKDNQPVIPELFVPGDLQAVVGQLVPQPVDTLLPVR